MSVFRVMLAAVSLFLSGVLLWHWAYGRVVNPSLYPLFAAYLLIGSIYIADSARRGKKS